jgi:hypothetical protein
MPSSSHEDVRCERGQFGAVSAKVIGIGRGPASIDPHVEPSAPRAVHFRRGHERDCAALFETYHGARLTAMVSVPLCKSFTATSLCGSWLLRNVAAALAAIFVSR